MPNDNIGNRHLSI